MIELVLIQSLFNRDLNRGCLIYLFVNPNKTWFFEGSFFWWGGQFNPPFMFQEDLSNINLTLYNC